MKLKLRGKLISSMGILTFLAVFLLSLLSNVSLQIAYNKVMRKKKSWTRLFRAKLSAWSECCRRSTTSIKPA